MGRALFEDPAVGCADCHPEGGTDHGWEPDGSPVVHDVGTLTPDSGHRLGGPLDGLDTPSLRGVWASPPYLHDGSARTLLDVLTTANPEDAHGTTSHLDEGELDALVDYLESL
jgi:cytochrome c peroxidase